MWFQIYDAMIQWHFQLSIRQNKLDTEREREREPFSIRFNLFGHRFSSSHSENRPIWTFGCFHAYATHTHNHIRLATCYLLFKRLVSIPFHLQQTNTHTRRKKNLLKLQEALALLHKIRFLYVIWFGVAVCMLLSGLLSARFFSCRRFQRRPVECESA